MAIIDTDVHPWINVDRIALRLKEPWRRRWLSGERGPLLPGYWNPVGVRRLDAVAEDGTRVETDPVLLSKFLLNAYGLEHAILNIDHLLYSLIPDPEYGAAVIAAINDVLLEEWLPVDPRFRISILVPMADPQYAVQEIERIGGWAGVVQVLLPGGSQLPYGNRFYHGIYAAANEFGLPVAIHPGNEGAGFTNPSTAVGYPSRYIEWHTSLSGTFQAHLVSLVTEGVFQKFPALKFVLIEGGVSWLPPLMWRLDKNWKALRQTVPWLNELPSEVIARHVLLTTQPLEEPSNPQHLMQMLDMFPAEQMLMFSSDYPHWDGDTPDFVGRAFSAKLRPRVLAETARELYQLNHG